MDAPLYRLTQDGAVNGIPERAGREFPFMGWPLRDYEPINEAARRISEYANANVQERPLTPRAGEHGDFYLPAFPHDLAVQVKQAVVMLPGGGTAFFNGEQYRAAASTIFPGMPAYTVTSEARFGGNVTKQRGETVFYLAWPRGSSIEPANDEARRVVDYFDEHSSNPNLPPCPWCYFVRAVILPDLPPVKSIPKPKAETSWQPPIGSR